MFIHLCTVGLGFPNSASQVGMVKNVKLDHDFATFFATFLLKYYIVYCLSLVSRVFLVNRMADPPPFIPYTIYLGRNELALIKLLRQILRGWHHVL